MDVEKELSLVLQGKEDRRELQERLLARHAWVLQIALNIPGVPKTLPGDLRCLEVTERMLCSRWKSALPSWERRCSETGAGKAFFWGGSFPEGEEIKKFTLTLEEDLPWGRILDMDLILPQGKTLSRRDFGYSSRRCFFCGEDAKVCARLGRHSYEELRRRAREFLAFAREQPSSF